LGWATAASGGGGRRRRRVGRRRGRVDALELLDLRGHLLGELRVDRLDLLQALIEELLLGLERSRRALLGRLLLDLLALLLELLVERRIHRLELLHLLQQLGLDLLFLLRRGRLARTGDVGVLKSGGAAECLRRGVEWLVKRVCLFGHPRCDPFRWEIRRRAFAATAARPRIDLDFVTRSIDRAKLATQDLETSKFSQRSGGETSHLNAT